MGRRSVTKGKVWEREVARLFRDAMPGAEIERGAVRQARDGAAAPDVDVPVFWPECKVGVKPNPRAALAQAQAAATSGRVPCAVIRDNQERPGATSRAFVVLDLADFLDFVSEWWERQ